MVHGCLDGFGIKQGENMVEIWLGRSIVSSTEAVMAVRSEVFEADSSADSVVSRGNGQDCWHCHLCP